MNPEPKSVLHVEDDEMFHTEIFAPFATDNGYKVYYARNYEEGMEKVRQQLYDWYVLDGSFPRNAQSEPEILCTDFYRELRQYNPSARVTILSIYDIKPVADELNVEFLDKRDPNLRYNLR